MSLWMASQQTSFFMIAAPDGANDINLASALAELSKYLLKDGFADKLRKVTSAEEVIAAFDAEEASTKQQQRRLHKKQTKTLSLQLPHVQRELPTPTWRKRPSRKQQLSWV